MRSIQQHLQATSSPLKIKKLTGMYHDVTFYACMPRLIQSPGAYAAMLLIAGLQRVTEGHQQGT